MKNKNLKFVLCLSVGLLMATVASCGEVDPSSTSSDTSTSTSADSTTSNPDTTTSGITTTAPTTTVDDQVVYTSWYSPDFVNDYNLNIVEQTNKREEFTDLLNAEFKVGSDNAWKFEPNVTIDEDGKDITPESFETSTTFYSVSEDGKTTTLLEQSDVTANVTVDNLAHTYKFNEIAEGKTFEIKVTPVGELQDWEDVGFVSSFRFKVVKGYNAYSWKDLTYIDNTQDIWKTFRNKEGMPEISPSKIIFQNAIEFTNDNIPNEFKYHKAPANLADRVEGYKYVEANDSDAEIAVDSLIDWNTLFNRTAAVDNDEFSIEGNYFKLDCSKVKNVVRPSDKIIWSKNGDTWTFSLGNDPMSHVQFMMIGKPSDTNIVKFEQNNLYTIGNDKVDGTDLLGTGGIIFSKGYDGANITINNNIAINWFISFFPVSLCDGYKISKTKGYDNYSSFLYNYGNKKLVIEDSEFINCGGPALISDHYSAKTEGDKYSPVITMKNSNLVSYVVGDEAWFISTGATAYATELQQVAVLLNQYGTPISKAFGDKHKLGIIGVIKNEGFNADGSFENPINGQFTIDGLDAINYKDPVVEMLTKTEQLNAAPIIVQPKTTKQTPLYTYFNGQAIVDATTNTPINPGDLDGDVLTIYLPGSTGNRISIVFKVEK